jgi:hypothetical protein
MTPQRDDAGRPVPKALAAPFKAKPHVHQWIDVMREMPRLLKEQLVKSGIEVNIDMIEEQTARMADLVESQLPYALCLCLGDGLCRFCGGKGYLTYGEAFLMKAAYGDLPRDDEWHKTVREAFKPGFPVKSKLAAGWKLSEARSYVESELRRWLAWPSSSQEARRLALLRTCQAEDTLSSREMSPDGTGK